MPKPDVKDIDLKLTKLAREKVKYFAEKQPSNKNKIFRISVKRGGCSGLEYEFSFDRKSEDDIIFTSGDIEVLVNWHDIIYINGSTVDFLDDMLKSGFAVINPNAKSTCSCGVSFNV